MFSIKYLFTHDQMSDIHIYVTSSLTSSERRVSPQWTLEYLKSRLELITGVEPQHQKLYIYRTSNSSENVEVKNSNETLVSELSLKPYVRLHVADTSDRSKELEDLLNNEPSEAAFKLSEKEYDSRLDSVKQWKKTEKLGWFDPQFQERKSQNLHEDAQAASLLKVGGRCRVKNQDRIGVISFIGAVPEIEDNTIWCGVEFDEPVGKNDGSIKGKRYFKCLDNYGSFIRPSAIEVGDFPEVRLDSDLEEL